MQMAIQYSNRVRQQWNLHVKPVYFWKIYSYNAKFITFFLRIVLIRMNHKELAKSAKLILLCKELPYLGYFQNTVKRTNEKCKNSCLMCVGSATDCITCKPGSLYSNRQCQDSCLDQEYASVAGFCYPCDPACKVCNGSLDSMCQKCNICKPGYDFLKSLNCSGECFYKSGVNRSLELPPNPQLIPTDFDPIELSSELWFKARDLMSLEIQVLQGLTSNIVKPSEMSLGGSNDQKQWEQSFDGYIKEFRLWKVARTSFQIKYFRTVSFSQASKDMISYWRLDDKNDGTTFVFYQATSNKLIKYDPRPKNFIKDLVEFRKTYLKLCNEGQYSYYDETLGYQTCLICDKLHKNCIESCPEGEQMDRQTGFCFKCNPNCKECFESPNNCSISKQGAFRQKQLCCCLSCRDVISVCSIFKLLNKQPQETYIYGWKVIRLSDNLDVTDPHLGMAKVKYSLKNKILFFSLYNSSDKASVTIKNLYNGFDFYFPHYDNQNFSEFANYFNSLSPYKAKQKLIRSQMLQNSKLSCLYWDNNNWTYEFCLLIGLEKIHIKCRCNYLSSFSPTFVTPRQGITPDDIYTNKYSQSNIENREKIKIEELIVPFNKYFKNLEELHQHKTPSLIDFLFKPGAYIVIVFWFMYITSLFYYSGKDRIKRSKMTKLQIKDDLAEIKDDHIQRFDEVIKELMARDTSCSQESPQKLARNQSSEKKQNFNKIDKTEQTVKDKKCLHY
ncbi:neurohypophysial n-terminal domain containing protein [Stylonychia lemnae]|uniref:Neurohypophysial n-terminal domain containing protein n=1 Tax=Stylonychia lemnae TaxID=5949 RepID=A0A078AV87_STYLE|nr:neurohypophysial n-terminal domain containing protein [Stylonychia lemnae]|eukprot:CDW85187.1 neurohypophysial n-terminal domain containing protein [Stylonychia lemnae]